MGGNSIDLLYGVYGSKASVGIESQVAPYASWNSASNFDFWNSWRKKLIYSVWLLSQKTTVEWHRNQTPTSCWHTKDQKWLNWSNICGSDYFRLVFRWRVTWKVGNHLFGSKNSTSKCRSSFFEETFFGFKTNNFLRLCRFLFSQVFRNFCSHISMPTVTSRCIAEFDHPFRPPILQRKSWFFFVLDFFVFNKRVD